MLLAKAQGGCTLKHKGASYTWEHDGEEVDVPVEFAMELLAIQGGDFSVPEEKRQAKKTDDGEQGDGGDDSKVTEPAPDGENAVTEPDPKATSTRGRRRSTAVTE